MSKVKGPPCIRGLAAFESTGCPMKCWDGESGCGAWLELPYENADPSKPDVIVKKCIDMVLFDLEIKKLKFLEGNQQATESTRNTIVKIAHAGFERQDKIIEERKISALKIER